ncbi:MAG: hypothetical protein HGB12_17955, partial [Bacteroidetes bacterium]|nr:hypothetical protein [Bacteroidota bacterium]
SSDLILTKHIDADYFKTASLPVFTDATSTFYPDANTESSSVDGYIVNDPEATSWATLHNASAGTATYDSNVSLYIMVQCGSNSNTYKEISRSFMLFNTSSIPDNNIISSATLSLYGYDNGRNADAFSSSLNIYSSSPASNTALITDDYDQVGSTEFSTTINYSAFSLVAYNDFTLNVSGIANISKTGISKFSWRDKKYDSDNIAMSWVSSVFSERNCYSADESGTDKDPKLVVTYTLPIFAPTVTTQAVTNITGTSSTGNGTVTDDGGAVISERGVCWNTSTTPTTANSKATSTGTTGAFTASMTGLSAGTLYYVRAYAINSAGTSYGNEETFTTCSPTTATVDWNNSNVQEITLSACRSFTFINGKSGGVYTLMINQDTSGGWTVAWPANVKWAGSTAPTFTYTANAVDIVKFVYNGTNYIGIAN